MKLTEHGMGLDKYLIVEATDNYEHSILLDFARPKDPLVGTVEPPGNYCHPYLVIRKEKS